MVSISKIRAAIAQGRQGAAQAITVFPGGRGGGSLVLRIRPGAKGEPACEWFADWRAGPKRNRLALGRLDVPAIENPDKREEALTHLEEIQGRFSELSKMLHAGIDPKAELLRREQERANAERQAKERGTVHDLLTAYVEHLREHGKKSCATVERALITGQFAASELLGKNRKAAEVTPRDIQRLLLETHKRGASMAAHVRAYLHGAFAFGVGNEFSYTRPRPDVRFDLVNNPVALVPRDGEAFQAGERVLSPAEIRLLWHDLPGTCEPATWVALRLLLAVGGQRVQEVLHARQDEFDLEAQTWTLPASRAKNGREHLVPLTERASSLVQKARGLAGKSEYLFPLRTDPARPMPSTSLNQVVRRFCENAKVDRFSPRDIRRTARTMLSEAGEHDHVLDRHFNHGLGGVGQKHYDRAQRLEEKRGVMARWDALLTKALEEAD